MVGDAQPVTSLQNTAKNELAENRENFAISKYVYTSLNVVNGDPVAQARKSADAGHCGEISSRGS